MWKTLVAALAFFSLASFAHAQTVQGPASNVDQIVAQLHFWSQGSGEPVYYGEVRNVDPHTMQPLGNYQCLELAFIDYKNGVISYAHKMWSKSSDGSCHYDDVTSKKVGNHGACVRDSDAGFGFAIGTARMTKANIDYQHSIFRTVNTVTRQVGETAACIPPRGATAGLYSIKIEDGRLKIETTRPLDYEVNINPQDPEHPPTKSVF